MGMRQNIALIYAQEVTKTEAQPPKTIYLYSHWGGEEGMSPLKSKLRKALARHLRWDDESYLARIIFEEVIKDSIGEETGYGLAPYAIDEEYPTIAVDLAAQTVDGVPFGEFVGDTLSVKK